ncbi:MAG: PQQ-binding-like beta-propeller repeat protein [bacterium]|nr:PQQ-binding-like beta-propeller repeat protein [bacterium]
MDEAQANGSTGERALRVWPGVALVLLQWSVWWGLPLVSSKMTFQMISAFGGMICGALVVLWWVFLSRARWVDRLVGAALLVGSLALTTRLVHDSVATAGMGFMYFVYAIPVSCLAFVLWAVLARGLALGVRRVTMVAAIVLACLPFVLIRHAGVDGDNSVDARWRWSQSPEQRLLAAGEETPAVSGSPVDGALDWPGFRGPGRDGTVPHVRIATDWSTAPPVELWRRQVGPGWSSFAVLGNLLFTQEQRGEEEIVAAYEIETGQPVWRHRDAARFYESQGGAGPRGTPAVHDGRVYSLGATGILNALEASVGTRLWSRDATADTGAEVPYWGVSASPLVVDDMLVVAVSGTLAGYDLATGDVRWIGPDGGIGYSSPHLTTIDDVTQVLQATATGLTGVAPADGTVLWEHAWEGFPMVQPARTPDGDVLFSANVELGMRRLAVAPGADGWTVEERWTTMRLKPYFNDFVVHGGHAYGFDKAILACIDLESGERVWKGGRYGYGQMVLLPDQDLLLVLSEKGRLALVQASPDGFHEVAGMEALDGKTWNHPVVVGDLLLIRNDREMAAFRL